jgi:hypothetical protein
MHDIQYLLRNSCLDQIRQGLTKRLEVKAGGYVRGEIWRV